MSNPCSFLIKMTGGKEEIKKLIEMLDSEGKYKDDRFKRFFHFVADEVQATVIPDVFEVCCHGVCDSYVALAMTNWNYEMSIIKKEEYQQNFIIEIFIKDRVVDWQEHCLLVNGNVLFDNKGYLLEGDYNEEYGCFKDVSEYYDTVFSVNEINSWPTQIVDLIATYEELYKVPANQQVTECFGDYGQYILKPVSSVKNARDVSAMYHKALKAIDMSADEYIAHKELFVHRGEIVELMKRNMLSPLDDKIMVAKGQKAEQNVSKLFENIER